MSEVRDHGGAKPGPKTYESKGSVKAPGGTVNYRTFAGWLRLRRGDRERERAEVFYTYYRAEKDDGRRPITFVFNGGPGAASAYLHMGALGPRRVVTHTDGRTPRAPAALIDNAETWLAFTDLVFVDPVGTGLSRNLPNDDEDDKSKGKGKKDETDDPYYWDVERDLESLCQFFERFLSNHKRWSAPIFIAGESYGGYRVARLVRKMQEDAGIGLSGAFIISPVLEWELLLGAWEAYDALAFAHLIPTMAATALAHNKVHTDLPLKRFLAEVERFAVTDLLAGIGNAALSGGPGLAEPVASKLSGYIGLPVELCVRHCGRVPIAIFARELLRKEGQVIGMYDGTITTDDPLPNEPTFLGLDPTLQGQTRLFTVAANTHLRDDLGVDDERRYHLINFDVNQKWSFKSADGNLLPKGATKDLVAGMASNPECRVVISHGYHDLVTPYFSSKYIAGLLRYDSPVSERLALKNFEGGHMFYTREASRKAFTETAAATVRAALG